MTTINQNPSSGYGTGIQTGITIDVLNGATVQGTGGAGRGIWVGDATIRNGVGASILGGLNGILSAGGITVNNSGTITGTTGTGISASSNVTLTNHAGGAILGAVDGIKSTTGSITLDNAGSIIGTSASAIDALTDITVINRAGGVISGGPGAIFARGGNVTLDNSGSITSAGTTVSAFDRVTLINRAGATISGGVIGGNGLDVNNSGNIDGVGGQNAKVVNTATGTIGIIGLSGGTGDIDNFGTVTLSVAGAGTLINHAGGSIASVTAVNMSVANFGSIGTVGAGAGGGVQLVNNVGAIIDGPLAGVALSATATASSISNAGAISGGTYGAIIENGGNTVTNLAGGTISGASTGIALLVSGNTVANLAGGNITGGASGVLSFLDVSITNSGTISATATPGAGLAVVGALQLVNTAGASISGPDYGIAAGGNSSIVNAGSISGGTAAIRFAAGGNTLTLLPGSVISGNVIGFGSDTLQLGGIGAANLDISQFSGFTTFTKFDSSIWTLTGTATYTAPVNVNGGTLAVNGNLASASLLTVNAGGILGGNGIVGVTAINGGTLAPGNSIGTLTMSSLTMTAASTYLVQVSGTLSDKAVITGTAAIAGNVSVDALARLTSTTTYTIINAGTLTGTFDTVSLTNNFARNVRLSYVGNDVLLTLDPGLLSPILPGNASINHRNVAAGIDNALEGGATMPASFNSLFALSGNNLLHALTQISGETSTGSQQTTFDAMTQFMGVLSDPFTAGRGGTAPGAFAYAAESDALAYAPGGRKRTRTERDAYAMFTKAPPRTYEARWNVWAAGFGGSRTTDGNTALGSNRTTGNIAAAAVGADYWFSPSTVAGFALAGGGTSFSVAGGGSGQSDLFQAGAFIRHTIASSYITATAAYGWQDISTDRLITAVGTERLRANFNANAFSGRIEAGNRWLLPELYGIGLTPYAAGQVTAFDLPAYGETSASGAGGFALNYTAKTVTALRGELGLRSDKSFAVNDAVLTLRGRAAWAYDNNIDRNVSAAFQSLPGSTFTVNGAQAARNAALTTASAEVSFNGGWSLAGTFEGSSPTSAAPMPARAWCATRGERVQRMVTQS
ncbi:autotransporter domain-containing protein [Tardiphaga sp.]|uniref:autotransporter outer membrane beta-barrel domain-containing protein n=1 Tax=Tardiphaga sp. TaxID=1926292 RepID=UPI002635CF82|nr:autotransporter domain-containing protein [Tardiphaga sp.]